MKRNNKALYELIMQNVSRELKRSLNESDEIIDDMPSENTSEYIVDEIMITMTEDDYNEGEDPSTSDTWDEDYKFTDKTIKGLVAKVAAHYECNYDEVFIYDDYVMMQIMADEQGFALNQYEMDQWRAGKIKGYAKEIRFKIKQFTSVGHDELVKNGFESYD